MTSSHAAAGPEKNFPGGNAPEDFAVHCSESNYFAQA
jgi:hypothetical protein